MAEKAQLRVINASQNGTTFDIIAIPAIGADPDQTWRFSSAVSKASRIRRSLSRSRRQDDQTSSLGSSIFSKVDSARVYFYTHPRLPQDEQRGFSYFARTLLLQLMGLPDLGHRPICFAAFSTGGLVIKQALIYASMRMDNQRTSSLLRRCFGLSFFGVPHYGSSILADQIQKENVAKLLKLDIPMSDLIRSELSSENFAELTDTSRDFATVSIHFKFIWSWLEGQTTTLAVNPGPQGTEENENDEKSVSRSTDRATTFRQTRIVDPRSGVLSTDEFHFGMEKVLGIDSQYELLACFGNNDQSDSYRYFVDELNKFASEVTGREAVDLENLSRKIFTEVNLFYEAKQSRQTYVKLWSERPSFYDLCEKGPKRCLEDSRIDAELWRNHENIPTRGRHFQRRKLRKPEKSIEASEGADLDASAGAYRSDVASVSSAAPGVHNRLAEDDRDKSDSVVDDGIFGQADEVQTVPEIVVTFVDPDEEPAKDPATESATNPVTEPANDTVRKYGWVRRKPGKLVDRPKSTDFIDGGTQSLPSVNSNEMRQDPGNRRQKDDYDAFMDDFDEYYAADAPEAASFFAPQELKTTDLVVASRRRPRTPRDDSAPGIENDWDEILDKQDAALDYQWSTHGLEIEFEMPSLDRVKFRWIHVPANNMLFVPAVLQALAIELREPSLQRMLLHRQLFDAMQHVPRHKLSHGRFMHPSCSLLVSERLSKDAAPLSISNLRSPIGADQLALYYPYLSWDFLGDLKSRNALRKRRRAQGKPYPVDKDIADACLEHQLIWFYLDNASNLPLHLRRSLDQYGYPNLSNTEARDVDQVISKRTRPSHKQTTTLQTRLAQMWDKERDRMGKKKKFWQSYNHDAKSEDDDSRVLMVDTMWLWIVDQTSVLTFFPSRRNGRWNPKGQKVDTADVHDKVYLDVNGDPRFARQCETCFDFAALSILHATTALLQEDHEPDLQVFGIFEEYLSELTEQQTSSFKQFRDSQLAAETNEGPKAVREMMLNLHNRDDLTALLELRDISDELRTLDKLFAEQMKVIEQMLTIFESLHKLGKAGVTATTEKSDKPRAIVSSNALQWLEEARNRVAGYCHQSQDMQRRCESVQEAYKLLLDMKQKQANVAEASLSRHSAEVASESNRTIMIFTIFTIIFLPLSFFTSLFGMNIREWSGVTTNPGYHQVFLIMGCVSAAIVIVALTLAFNRPIRLKVISAFHRSVKRWPAKVLRFTYQKLFGSCVGDRNAISEHAEP